MFDCNEKKEKIFDTVSTNRPFLRQFFSDLFNHKSIWNHKSIYTNQKYYVNTCPNAKKRSTQCECHLLYVAKSMRWISLTPSHIEISITTNLMIQFINRFSVPRHTCPYVRRTGTNLFVHFCFSCYFLYLCSLYSFINISIVWIY